MIKFDTSEKLSTLTVVLHWGIGLTFIAMLILGHIVEDMERSPLKFELLGLHKAVGVVLLAFISLRIIWRLSQGLPAPLGPFPKWQLIASKAVHIGLLVGTLLMPISGVVMSVTAGHDVNVFSMFIIPGWTEPDRAFAGIAHGVHETTSEILVLLIAVHIGAALFHHLRLRDGVLLRMLGRKV